jgi:hypothetical protein
MGSIEFDHALVVRDIAHAWHLEPATTTAPNHPWLQPIEPSSPIAVHRQIFTEGRKGHKERMIQA